LLLAGCQTTSPQTTSPQTTSPQTTPPQATQPQALQSQPSTPDDSFNQAIQTQKFKHAEAILNKQFRQKQLTSPQYQQQKSVLEKADRLHSTKVLQRVTVKINTHYWQEAEALLLAAERNSINPKIFNTAFKRLFKQERIQLASLKLRTKKAKMVWLQTANNNISALNQSTLESPLSRFNQFRYKLMIRHANRTFFHCAKNNFDSNHLIRSRSCFTFIDRENLPPTLETEYQILSHYFAKQDPVDGSYLTQQRSNPRPTDSNRNRTTNEGQLTSQKSTEPYLNAPYFGEQSLLNNAFNQQAGYTPKDPATQSTVKKIKQPSAAEKHAQLKTLLQQLETDLANVNLLDINATLSTIATLEPNPLSEQKKIRQAKQFLSGQITKLDQRADNFYSHERISQAHSIWEYLLKLDPGNAAIKQKQDRSQRVIEKMRTLREEQPANNSLADAIEGPWRP